MIDWNSTFYHGRYNKYPFTEVVAFMMRTFRNIPDRSGIRVLDLGYGGAHHLMFLAQEGFNYYGIDGSSEALEIAKTRLAESGYDASTISVGTFENLPYEDNFFDCVIDRGSITCNPLSEIKPLLEETRRVLKPNGWLFSMFLNDAGAPSHQAARGLGNGDYTDFSNRLEGAGILHYTNTKEALEMFSAFKIQEIVSSISRAEYSESKDSLATGWIIVKCKK